MKYTVTAVSYTNTWPFIYGLEHNRLPINLKLEAPAMCARLFANRQADIALVPVGALPDFTHYRIFSDFCIGAENNVRTVTLMSQVPLPEITEIHLDYQSRTSVKLVRILAQNFWHINPEFLPATQGYENNIRGTSAAVIIGDRVFEQEQKVKYIYDLSEQWFLWKKLPMVFAVWIARKDIPEDILKQLNNAFQYGIEHITDAVNQYWTDNTPVKKPVIENYLQNNIKYPLNETMLKSIRIFLEEEQQLCTTP